MAVEQPKDEPVDDQAKDAGDESQGDGVVERNLGLPRHRRHSSGKLRHIETKLSLIPGKSDQNDIAATEDEEAYGQ